MKRLLLGALCAVALVGCGDHEAERKAQAAAQAQAKAQAAEDLAKQYAAAAASANWELARIHGAALLQQYPDSAAAERIRPGYAEVKAKGEAARELRRMQAAWQYSQVPAGKGVQRAAMLYSRDKVDVDGSGPKPVQLVFRDHPEWKRSAYLVLQSGDFRCANGCKVELKADAGVPRPAAASRPKTDEAIAMFITDNKALWKLARKTTVLQITFPVKAGGTRTAVFETGGLDGAQMPGWD
ncbi:hypothetical protein [Xanthomonas albilineans]|uniref:hypothetical protein n=1 Tax=Xanthomonas albilineans TaxID=29447 RepID=UPI0005F35BCF|nr:hypothetical protein [Xanthomonas albilineans]